MSDVTFGDQGVPCLGGSRARKWQQSTLTARACERTAAHFSILIANISIPELGLQVGMLNDTVRFWLGSSLLMLPGEMRREIDELRQP